MSLGLADKEIARYYQEIVSGSGTEWMVLSYDKASNDLKVQANGDGGLEEMAEEFMDSRMQYGFIRVKDPNTQLPKFVQINWCGDGVPENRKGHFYSHSTAMSRYLQGTHVVINARNESDLDTGLIMQRVNNASGSKYSVHNERAKAAAPIAPVGTSYTPIGQPDIAAMRSTAKKPPPAATKPPVASSSSAPVLKPVVAAAKPPPSATPTIPIAPRPVAKASIPDWDDEPTQAPVRVFPVQQPPTASAAAAPPAPAPASHSHPKLHISTDTKPADDVIGPVGTNYVPVALPKPKKLVNPFAARQQEAAAAAAAASQPSPIKSATGTKKLTWSERQAMAKKEREEEEARSSAAANASKAAVLGVTAATVGVGLAGAAAAASAREEPANIPAPPPPPPPPAPPAPPPPPVVVSSAHDEEEEEVDYPAPPAPPPPPAPPAPPAPAAPAPAVAHEEHHKGGAQSGMVGKVAIVTYDYDASEENEMNLIEGEYIEQIEELDDGWWQGVAVTDKNRTGLFPANYVEVVENHEPEPEPEIPAPPPPPPPPAPPAPPPPPAVVAAPVAPPAPVAPEPEPAADEGSTAIALYDYDAAEENEISFSEGDRITNITAASDDWWEGVAPNGRSGLFPANYVELEG